MYLKLTRKGDVSMEKTLTQIKIIIPSELQQAAKDAFNNCHLIRKYPAFQQL